LFLFIFLALLLGSVYGLLYQQIARFLLGLLAVLVFGLMGGISNASLENSRLLSPNQGIWRSVRNSLISGMIAWIGCSLLVGIVFDIALGLFYGLIYGVTFGLVFGIWITSQYGGVACLQYLSVRILLWQMGAMPWKYSRFLDYASKQILLTKIGGGYIFVHRLLLEYFATLDTNQQTQPIAEPISRSRRFVLAGSFAAFLAGSGIALTKAIQAIPSLSVQPGTPLYIYGKHTGQVGCVAWSPDGQYLLSVGNDTTVRVWHSLTGDDVLIFCKWKIRFAAAANLTFRFDID
jgi:WD domain, G-beta repeat